MVARVGTSRAMGKSLRVLLMQCELWRLEILPYVSFHTNDFLKLLQTIIKWRRVGTTSFPFHWHSTSYSMAWVAEEVMAWVMWSGQKKIVRQANHPCNWSETQFLMLLHWP